MKVQQAATANPIHKLVTMFADLNQKKSGCQCVFDGICSCESAMHVLGCMEKACSSGDCQCVDANGVNHSSRSCTAIANECPGIGLTCALEQTTCAVKDIAAPVRHTAAVYHVKTVNGEFGRAVVPVEKFEAMKVKLEGQEHRSFAQVVITIFVVFMVGFAMASSRNQAIAKHTWASVDGVVPHFIAVSWHFLLAHFIAILLLEKPIDAIAHVVLVFIAMVVSCFSTHSLKNKPAELEGFRSICNALLMWVNAGAVQSVQSNFQSSYVQVLLSLVGMTALYAIIVFALDAIKPSREWNDGVENSATAGMFTAGLVLWMHMLLTGEYRTIKSSHPTVPGSFETDMLIVHSIALFVAAVVLTPPLQNLKKKASGYWLLRVYDILLSVVGLLPYFGAALTLPHVFVVKMGFVSGDTITLLAVAIVSSLFAVLLICICTFSSFLNDKTNEHGAALIDILIGFGSFLMGMGWSSLLDNSVTAMSKAEGDQNPFTTKLVVTVLLTMIILPIYILSMKPVIMSKGS